MFRLSYICTAVLFIISLLPGGVFARTIPLDGDWFFIADPSAQFKVADLAQANKIPVRVPSSWQSAFVDRRDYAGVAWYLRTFTAEPPAKGNLLFVRFACDLREHAT